jgi:hypothetical protein
MIPAVLVVAVKYNWLPAVPNLIFPPFKITKASSPLLGSAVIVEPASIVTPETTTGRILLEYNYQTHTFWSIVKSPVISPVTGSLQDFL